MRLNLNGKMQGKPEAGPPTVMQDSEKKNKTEFVYKGEAAFFLVSRSAHRTTNFMNPEF